MSVDEEFGKSLLSSVITVAGLILTLSWALFDWNLAEKIKKIFLPHLKWCSTFLGISLVLGILCYQFLVSASQSNSTSAMKSNGVAITFVLCWLCFLVGIGIFIVGIWRL